MGDERPGGGLGRERRQREEDRRYDDWTVAVDDILKQLAARQGEIVEEQRRIVGEQRKVAQTQETMKREVDLVGRNVRTLTTAVDGLQSGTFTHDQVEALAEVASERIAQKMIERRREFLGRRWQRVGVIAALVCAPLSVILAAVAIFVHAA